MAPGPRPHHYVYAHKMLPKLFHGDPTLFIATMLDARETFLRKVWDDLGQRVEDNDGPRARLPSDGLGVYFERLPKDVLVAVVELPEAKYMPEAHLVAFVYQLPESAQGRLRPGRAGMARMFTLEYGLSLQGDEPRTVLCEWSADGTHRNLGDGPPATIDDFIEKIASLV